MKKIGSESRFCRKFSENNFGKKIFLTSDGRPLWVVLA